METKVFKHGNYIYECKSSPTKMNDYFDTGYLRAANKKLRQRWHRGPLPSGYRYIFPVNYLDSLAKTEIDKLQSDFPSIDIRYYECDEVDRLIFSLEKVGDLLSLVAYIKILRGA